jgi:hypothetical protein
MSKKTLLMLPKDSPGLSEHIDSGHQRARVRDTGVTAEGREIVQLSSSLRLKEAQAVSRVTLDRDADGNLYITLEE